MSAELDRSADASFDALISEMKPKPRRKRKPTKPRKRLVVSGDKVKSRNIRVDAGFADFLNREARRQSRATGARITTTDVSRQVHDTLKAGNHAGTR